MRRFFKGLRPVCLSFVIFLSLTGQSPANDALTPPIPGAVMHYAVAGDSWQSLSSLYAVSVEELRRLNPQDQVSEGAMVWVPPSPRGWPVHRVVSGQTLWRISKGYGISVEQLKQANGLTSNDLMPGNVLVLPRAAKPEWAQGEQVVAQPVPQPVTQPAEAEWNSEDSVAEPRRAQSLSSRSGRPQERAYSVDKEVAGWVEVRLPDNRRAWVKSADLVLGSWQPQSPETLVAKAREFVGVPYKWGGVDPNGYDCSGFVQEVFRLAGYQVPRMADVQYEKLEKVATDDLEVGDLVFFNTDGSGISHVGIYSGDNRFLHASSSRGVVESGLDESYYKSRFVGAARLPDWQQPVSVNGEPSVP